MNITKYRQYIVDNMEKEFINAYSKPLNIIYKNDQLVEKGLAYWQNSYTLCTGYKLKDNPEFYLPIFSHYRQNKINNFQKQISYTVNKRNKNRAYIEIYKFRFLPKVMLNHIIDYAY